jgi:catechol 2,3-dioxygenase-like lactoylglutathione lyase family enzyme
MASMKPTQVMMVTVQVRDFGAAIAWYRDVLGLSVLSLEPDEFCMLVPPGSTGPALALATDHPDRISPRPGIGWADSGRGGLRRHGRRAPSARGDLRR